MSGKKRPVYKWNDRMLIWIAAAVALIAWELVGIFTRLPGGPLSHLAWYAYGEPWSLRWWLCSGFVNGFLFWCGWHFMFHWPSARELGISVAVVMALSALAWVVMRLVN